MKIFNKKKQYVTGLLGTVVIANTFAAGLAAVPVRHSHKIYVQKAVNLNVNMPYRSWLPHQGSPKIILLCIHGLGLNSRSYERFGQSITKYGIATYAIDVRGFGHWMKVQGKEQIDFEACLSDIEQFLKALHQAYGKLPVYILGESMGGAIALRVTALHPELMDGLISAVPSGDRFHKTRNQLQVALRVVTGQKNKPMDVGSRVIKQATDDPALQERWKGDPLNRMELTPKELMQFQSFMNENHDAAQKIADKPVLVICGFKDRLVKPQGTVELFNELETPDKMLVILGNGEHLIFEEEQLTDQACWVLMGWLKNHTAHGTALDAHSGTPLKVKTIH